MPPIIEENEAQDLSKKTVCLKMHIGVLGNRRKVPTTLVEVEADKALVRVSKVLLDSTELQNVKRLDADIRRFVYSTCLPFEVGVHLLPFPLIETAEERLREFQAEREKRVEAFIAAYPRLCSEASLRLRSLYNPNDYPPVDQVRAKFSLAWRYVNFGVPGQLRSISVEIFKNEREKAAKAMADAAADIQQVMRASLAELVGNLQDRLGTDEEGKPKRLRASTVENLREFLNSFDFRNVVDDQELKAQVERARLLISGVDADTIRSNEALRAQLGRGMDEIKTKLSTMVVSGPRRKFRFDEEESAAEAA